MQGTRKKAAKNRLVRLPIEQLLRDNDWLSHIYVNHYSDYEYSEDMKFENPITLSELNLDNMNIKNIDGQTGDLVAVRPCDEKYGNKTYLGFYLGELPVMVYPSLKEKEQKLDMMTIRNPAMYVPEIKKIIWGAGSWWKKIDSEEDFREITDGDINNTWYVQLAKKMFEKDETNP